MNCKSLDFFKLSNEILLRGKNLRFLTKARRIGGRLLPYIQGFKAYRNLAKRLIKPEVLYRWESSEGSGKHLLGKRNGIVIGRVTIHNSLEVNSLYHDPGWWIFGMWVNWWYRGLGIGKRLTEMVCDFAAEHGASEVKLPVFRDNKPP